MNVPITTTKLYISCTLWQQRIKYNIIIYARVSVWRYAILLYRVKDKAATYDICITNPFCV